MDIKQIVLDLCALSDEQEWFEFKENWFQPEALGEYVSALSNAAAFHYKKYAYFIWGVNDTTHEIVGTTFNQYCEYNKEPYQNYLASGPLTYIEALFAGMLEDAERARQIALDFYGPIFLLYSIYDGAEDKSHVIKLLEEHMDHFLQEMQIS